MRIEKISWKNFQSYGDEETSIVFKSNEGNLNLIVGDNGAGKSTICSVLSFALYGKVEGKNKGELINRTNKKNLVVEVFLKCSGKKIYIQRGISPNILKVFVNDIELENSNADKLQDTLEKEYFKVEYSLFKNLLSLSINDFKSLLSLSPSDKRQILDKLFGFSVLNNMKEKIKEEKKQIEIEKNSISAKISAESQMLDKINYQISEISKFSKPELEKVEVEILNISDDLKKLEIELKDVESVLKELSQKKKEENQKIVSIKASISVKKKALDVHLTSTKCPHCHSEVSKSTYDILLNSFKDDLKIEAETLSELTKDLEIIDTKLQNAEEIKKQLTNKKSSLQTSLYSSQSTKKSLEKTSKDSMAKLQEISEDSHRKVQELEESLAVVQKELNFLELFERTIGDDLKVKMISSILPTLNSHLKVLCAEFKLPYFLEFDSKFDCKIKVLTEEISIKSLSTGQKKIADSIAIIAILKILKLQLPSLNILFLDEVFSSLDSYKAHEIVKLFSMLSKELNLEIFLINHASLPSEFFDKTIEIKIHQGFSRLTQVNEFTT